MKSTWAYRNGKRQMNEVKDSFKINPRGFVEKKIAGDTYYFYAEAYNGKLMVKVYANKKQANKVIERLQSEGVDFWLKSGHPFVVVAENITNWNENN